jgi:Domain of unknown function (DUF4258)
MDQNVVERLRDQAAREAIRVTQHAQQEMVEDRVDLDDVLAAVRSGELLEDYPAHRRGPCCLLCGYTGKGRPLHVVCTTAQPLLIVVFTVYEPKPPKWISPQQRGPRP